MSFSPLKGRWSENRWKTKRDNLPYANFCLVKFHEELQPSHRLNCKNSNSHSHDPNLFAEHKMCTLEENSKNFTRESRDNPTKENPQSAQDTNETFTPKKILNAHQKLTSQSE